MRDKYNRSPVAAEAEGVVLLPGRPARSVVVAVTLAKTTVLRTTVLSQCDIVRIEINLTCLPTEVRPRASRRLCTGFVIQLILGSRRICKQVETWTAKKY